MNSIFSFFTRRHINHDNASVVISFGMYNFTCSFIRYSNDSIIFCSTEAYINNNSFAFIILIFIGYDTNVRDKI